VSPVYLDTHAAVFLHAGEVDLLGTEGKRQIELNNVLISPMVLLELEYLHASRVISYRGATVYEDLNRTFGITLCPIPFAAVAQEALGIDWTRDPFDRLIVAQARAGGDAPLITRDRVIRRWYRPAIW
jgi:PIN domain nuclease of toxin-antitoxin system